MRRAPSRRVREWELPSGAMDPATQAIRVSAGLKRDRDAGKFADVVSRPHRNNQPKRRPTTDAGGLISPDYRETLEAQGRLLARARRGDAEAVRELRDRFKAWIVPGQ